MVVYAISKIMECDNHSGNINDVMLHKEEALGSPACSWKFPRELSRSMDLYVDP
jgi:hypothetical protein